MQRQVRQAGEVDAAGDDVAVARKALVAEGVPAAGEAVVEDAAEGEDVDALCLAAERRRTCTGIPWLAALPLAHPHTEHAGAIHGAWATWHMGADAVTGTLKIRTRPACQRSNINETKTEV